MTWGGPIDYIEAPKGEQPQGAEFETPKVSSARGLGREGVTRTE